MIKKLICMLCTLSLLITIAILPASAAETDPVLTIGGTEGKPGETVSVNVTMLNNPGIICMTYRISYDETRLTLSSVEDKNLMTDNNGSAASYIASKDFTFNPYYQSWTMFVSSKDFSGDGVLTTLGFTIKDNAPSGDAEIKLIPDSIFNLKLNKVDFKLIDGKVAVIGGAENNSQDGTKDTGNTTVSEGSELAGGSSSTDTGSKSSDTKATGGGFAGETPSTSTVGKSSDSKATDSKTTNTKTEQAASTSGSPKIAYKNITKTDAEKAAANAVKNTSSKTANVKFSNINTITKVAAQAIKKQADKSGKTLNVIVDNRDAKNKLDVRMTINPSKVKNDLSVYASSKDITATKVKAKFDKTYKNTLSVVNLGQKGSFGQAVRVALKLSAKTDASKLRFYYYDAAVKKYKMLKNTNAKVDKSGYLHFSTSVGEQIIISNGALKK